MAGGDSDIWGLESSRRFFTHISSVWTGMTWGLGSAGTVCGRCSMWLGLPHRMADQGSWISYMAAWSSKSKHSSKLGERYTASFQHSLSVKAVKSLSRFKGKKHRPYLVIRDTSVNLRPYLKTTVSLRSISSLWAFSSITYRISPNL